MKRRRSSTSGRTRSSARRYSPSCQAKPPSLAELHIGTSGILHECNILHGSPDNIAGDPRTILMCVYNSVHNHCEQPLGGVKPRLDFLSNRDQ